MVTMRDKVARARGWTSRSSGDGVQALGEFRDVIKAVIGNVERAVLGKRPVIEMALASVLGGGHVLLEDVPGVAKTVLVRAMARTMGCTFSRIQCTPDLLPTDVSGVSVFNQKTGSFEFRPGPVFSQVVVADEINRATPRTQSALLEAMGEGQVSADGVTHRLEKPFIVFATQNPVEHEGTFPLPEAQLDRFMMRLTLGYPDIAAEASMLEMLRTGSPVDELEPVADAAVILRMQAKVREIHIHKNVRDYLLRIVSRSRDSVHLTLGASPRAAFSFFRAAQACAAVRGRAYVIPDDIKGLARAVLEHRLILNPESRLRRVTVTQVVRDIIEEVATPSARGGWA